MNIFKLYAGGAGVEKIREAFEGQIGHTISRQHDTFWETWYIPVRGGRGEITRVARQQQVIRALSTPIIEVWDKVLTLPLLGVVDSARVRDDGEPARAGQPEGGPIRIVTRANLRDGLQYCIRRMREGAA